MQVDSQHHHTQPPELASSGPGSRAGASSWSGMDSVEYMHSGGYGADHFAADHTAFMSYSTNAESGNAGNDSTASAGAGHQEQRQQQSQPPNESNAGMSTESQAQLSAEQSLFPTASGSFSADAIAADPHLGAAMEGKNRLAASFGLSMPTPPDSNRRPSTRHALVSDMDVDSPDTGNTGKISHGMVLQRTLSGPEVHSGRSRRGMGGGIVQSDADLESPTPLGMIHNRMAQHGSPTPHQRHLMSAKDELAGRVPGMRTNTSHRSTQSLGQAGQLLSQGGGFTQNERPGHSGMHISAPVSPIESVTHSTFPSVMSLHGHQSQGMMGPSGMQSHPQHPHQQHSRHTSTHSVRSASPSSTITSTSLSALSAQHGGTQYPMAGRFHPDSSFGSQDTSTDSISNTASTSVSRASSTSDELLSHDFSGGFVPASLRMAKRKRKLLNLDRKLICDFQVANPDVKQDTIATKFGIERSTVSKILKQKDKWLKIDPSSDSAKIAKHRTAKFPEVEDRLTEWVSGMKKDGKAIHDVMIRQEALRIAKELGLTVDKFKASGGWIEKFRERNQLPKSSPGESADVAALALASGAGVLDQTSLPPQVPMSIAHEHTTGLTSDTPSSSCNPLPSVMTPSSSVQALKPDGLDGADQKTPTSSQKRQYDAMASGLDPSNCDSHLSPLNNNMARMQFAPQPCNEFEQTPPVPPSFGPGPGPGHAHTSSHPGVLFGPRGFGDGPGNLVGDGQSHQHQAPFMVNLEMQERDGGASASKRRRAGTDGARVDAGILGPPWQNRQMHRESMESFSFPSTPVNQGGRVRHAPSNPALVLGSPHEGMAATPSRGRGARRARATRGRTAGGGRKQAAGARATSPLKRDASRDVTPEEGNAMSDTAVEAPTSTNDDEERAQLARRLSERVQGSIVTAEQAQRSLELVLRFLSEQPSNFLPSSHFVVFGHLQANIEQLIRERMTPGASSAGPSRQTSRQGSPVLEENGA